MIKHFVLRLIRFYQKHLSFKTSLAKTLFLTDSVCRFTPSCSEYTYQAISRYGIMAGISLGLKRIIRCHPFSKGGHDPLP